MKKFFALLTAVVVSFSAAQSHAIQITLTPSVVGAFNAAFEPIALPDITTNPGFSAVYQVDFGITVTNVVAPESGFANVGFNIGLTNLTADSSGWAPNTATVDSNGAAPGGVVPLFATNVDGGTVGDLQGILTSIAGGVTLAADPRRTVGQASGPAGHVPGPALIGSIFVTWDGVSPATLNTNGVLFSVNSTTGSFADLGPGAGATINFGGGATIPEPSTMVMGGLSLIGLAFRRRMA